MKKTKILMPLLGIASLGGAIAPLTSMTSCSSGSSIEIKKNDNVTINASSIKKGEDFVMTYELASGYGFDIVESKITIGEDTVFLLQCNVDTTNKKITVPGRFVTDTKAIINIKAESNAVVNVTASEYNTAWNKLTVPAGNRKATITTNDITVAFKGGEQTYSNVKHNTAVLRNQRSHTISNRVINDQGTEVTEGEYYTVEDEKVGFWDMQVLGSGVVYSYPTSLGSTDGTILSDRRRMGDFAKLTHDSVYNVLTSVYKTTESGRVYQNYVKFNADKQITYFGYVYTQTVDQLQYYNVTAATVAYDAEWINGPEQTIKDTRYVHELTSGTELSFDENATVLGRYELTVPSAFTAANKLVLTFDKVLTGITSDTFTIVTNNGTEDTKLVEGTDWTYSLADHTITIKSGKWTPGQKVYMTIGYSTTADTTGVTKLTLSHKA